MRTAVVTGASSGIGAAFADHLARAGYRLIIAARDEQRLERSAEQLRAAGAPEVIVAAVDLTDRVSRHKFVTMIADEPIDLLVNNAGASTGKSFTDATEADVLGQLELNVAAVMTLTHAVLPGMTARGHGGIINVASIAGLLPGRGSTYSASKAWVISFTEGIAMSLRGTGVRMVALCPGFVRTEFHERAKLDMSGTPGWMYVPMDAVVGEAMAGLRSGKTVVIPGVLYKAVAAAAKLAPRTLVRAVAARIDKDKRD